MTSTYLFKMKLSLTIITLLAGFAVALPQSKGQNKNNGQNNNGNDNQDAAAANDDVNAAANDGSGGVAAAAKAEAAILLTENGDGTWPTGTHFFFSTPTNSFLEHQS